MNIDLKWLSSKFPDLANLTPLGVGGQKSVFAADHPADEAVVLKIIKPTQSLETVEREIKAVQQVNSSRVPSIIEYGTISSQVGDCIWIREQRIDGRTLREELNKGPMPPLDVLRLALQMLEALQRAEEESIVHRDVKPENIMVDGRGDFWLLDFGLARHLALDSLTATAWTFGKFTLGYAPMEQCRNDKPSIDGRADLFALGVTLHECFIGRNHFRHGARDYMEILKNVEKLDLPQLNLGLLSAAQIQDFVTALTQKRRDHRPPNVKYAYLWMESICMAEGL
jgi:serine/threonine protein kinase